jgi:SAM-dependent methyltransferase
MAIAAAPTIAGDALLADRRSTRQAIFLSDDGVVLCATLRALDELGMLEPSLAEAASLTRLLPDVSPSGFGYLRSGLRTLASQGWIEDRPASDPAATFVRWTGAGHRAMRHRDRYVAVGRFLSGFASAAPGAWARPWDGELQRAFLELLDACVQRWRLPGDRAAVGASVAGHLDGALAVPALLSLVAGDRLDGRAPRLPGDRLGQGFRLLLETLGWLQPDGSWSASGRRTRDYAVHFGIVGSYLPLLARLPDLYRGELTVPPRDGDAAEWHVNRELNVLASAAAHAGYFTDADEIFVDLFDREPLEAQPRFIADMGCGDGSWLVHLDRLVRAGTLRGRHLDDYPLQMVGIDLNAAALDSARRRLAAAGVQATLLSGDVGDPDALASALAEHGLAIEDGLHIRSFLDHDRGYASGAADVPASGRSSGAYVDGDGRPLDPADVERDLVAHLRRWSPHVRRHGMVVLEAHCVAPSVARRHLGALHSVAFDSYHAYSHQYPVDHAVFVECCRLAGLERVGHRERQYPSSRPFVAVSLNRLVSSRGELRLAGAAADARAGGWRPDPGTDLEDGEALHRLLFDQGDLRHPRAWCSAATAYVAEGALAVIEARLREVGEGETIRVLDYGTGTGLAAIELLKGCRERRVGERLADRGAALELHLLDIPSSWFAQGHALLGDCAWARFHSLRSSDGRFAPLREILGGCEMDAAMASMVFHLIPPRVLDRVASELAGVLVNGGRLIWSSPDLAPSGANAVLFHDANRALRARWLECGAKRPGPRSRDEGQARADRRILARPQTVAAVVDALGRHFDGALERPSFEMTDEEILDAILVPSNQGEYLSEIADRGSRERTIAELMLGEVLPEMRASTAGTAFGLNVRWTLGDFGRRAPDGWAG